MARKILEGTIEAVYVNIIFQVASRCVTFLLNGFTLRYLNEGVVGVMNVRLLLLESTILFLSREAFRRACMSQTSSHNWPQIINLLWLTVPLSMVVSVIFSLVWLHILSLPSDDITTHYDIGVWSISISCVIKMISEPLCLVATVYLFNKLQVVISSISILVRTLIFAFWIIYKPDQAVIAFSAAQVVANILHSAGFYVYFYYYIKENNKVKKLSNIYENYSKDSLSEASKAQNDTANPVARPKLIRRQSSIVPFDEFPFSSLKEFLPSIVLNQAWVHPNSAQLTWSFLKQGVLKQVLTEGERYVMTLFSIMSFNEQGIYDVVNNLGSLAARFLFRPVEDSLYLYFSQSIKRDTDVNDQNQNRMKEAATVLQQALKCVVALGLVIITFGQTYSVLLLHLYGGEFLSKGDGPILLKAHCFSVLLLGVNGITECYSFSTMTADELNKYNYFMAAFSVAFLAISWGLTILLGGVGFIIANCCNMAARIVHSVIFINSKYKNTDFQPMHGLKPNKYFLASLAVSLCVTLFSEHYCGRIVHFLIGGLCFLLVSSVYCYLERELVLLAINTWREKRKSKAE
ncbi:UNVERIFIED_CONTAM: hypothetical protein PYX00_004329 [Menopon gallinae]|uniref:Protein RFT1 homolog n=1 Tax=Menopon gallinae TaxID=328185 RepID=A0AAW2I370_9NEOP